MSYRYLRYLEGENKLELDIERIVNGKSIIYIPNDDKWYKQMGDWSRSRKVEILENIKEEMSLKYEIDKYIFEEF